MERARSAGSSSRLRTGKPDAGLDFKAQLAQGLGTLLRRVPRERELEAFASYLSLLLRWNRVQSLTAYRKPMEILDKLFLDSLLFLPLLPAPPSRLLDLGSGAGIPGVPLKIVEPAYELTLAEARRRRTSFLSAVVRELALEGVRVLAGRAEILIEELPELEAAFDAVVTRGTGRPGEIVPLALQFLRPGGRLVASGPPPSKSEKRPGFGMWQTVTSPVSGLPRRFLVVEKT